MSYTLPSQGATTITTLGTIATGVWNATALGVIYGGTGLTSTTANQILYSSATNTIAGLASAASGVLITSAGSVPSISTTLPAALTIPQPNIVGTTTNNNAAAGSVGEFVSSTIVAGSGVSLTNNTPADVTSISLTAGDWDVWGNVTTSELGTTTGGQAWINTTSATVPDASLVTYNRISGIGGDNQGMPIVRQRFSLSGTTTVYLSCTAFFTTSTATGSGNIFARRVR